MRKLVAALACRVQGSRLYGKPIQNLDIESQVTVLDHIISLIQTIPQIQGIVLGISEGKENSIFMKMAEQRKVDYILGNEKDVLKRLIDCGRKVSATDLFRVTTESPFFYYDAIPTAWEHHICENNDVTTIDGLPEGAHFEIYTQKSLELSHELGNKKHRSEYCSLYIREHRKDFKIEILPILPELARLDLRLTIDYPEDLVLCRKIYTRLKGKAPRLPLKEIISFIDAHPELQAMVKPYVVSERLW